MIDLRTAKKNMREIVWWCGGLTVIVVFGGMVTKKLVADPLAANSDRLMTAVIEERTARQQTDEELLARIQRFESGEADSLMAIRIARLGRQMASIELRMAEVQSQTESIMQQTSRGPRQQSGRTIHGR